jgi:hypothetical protein
MAALVLGGTILLAQQRPAPLERQAPRLVEAPPAAYLLPVLTLAWLIPAAIAARRARARDREEEDQKTPYAEEELMQAWEFKIIRHRLGRFDRPAFLERILKEESQAGWQLLEKLDGRRVRLKRPGDRRAGDAALPKGYDPFRTRIGPSEVKVGLWAATGTCAFCGAVFAALGVATNPHPFFWSLAAVSGGMTLLFAMLGCFVR